MNKLLSHQEKKRLHQYLMWRDGNKCLYCKKAFKSTKEPIIEHLNDDRNDNRWDNLAYAHQRCNVLKGTQDSTEYLDIGLYKLGENELHNYVKEGFLEEPKKEPSTEIDISKKCYDITEQYLVEKIIEEGWIYYKGVIPNIVYLARTKTDHGSEQSIRAHLKALTSDNAPFEVVKDKNGKRIIRKRIS
ncbi:MAG: hypothetical protein HN500_05265 [Nitrosopumilus sp.]|jgi:hypothetical protein|nr:hypothetical protein [Nitrosopumilus sp.]